MQLNLLARGAASALLMAVLVTACSQSPAAPSETLSIPGSATGALDPQAVQAAHLTPAELTEQGWTCAPAPLIPNRVTCSPPNQGHPIQLPGAVEGRPATYSLLVFDSGVFVGTDLLIRSDLYNNQPCRSTGGPYRFIPRIGYYECLHPAGGS